jgi:hypothetical protein
MAARYPTKKERKDARTAKETAQKKAAKAALTAARAAKKRAAATHHLSHRAHHSGKPHAAIEDDIAAGPLVLRMLDDHLPRFLRAGFTAADRALVASTHEDMVAANRASPAKAGREPALDEDEQALVGLGIELLEAHVKSIGRAVAGLTPRERERLIAPFTTADDLRPTDPGPLVHAIDVFAKQARKKARFLAEECCVSAAMVEELVLLREKIAPLGATGKVRVLAAKAEAEARVANQLAFEAALRKYAAACYGVFAPRAGASAKERAEGKKQLVAALELIPRRRRKSTPRAEKTVAGPALPPGTTPAAVPA